MSGLKNSFSILCLFCKQLGCVYNHGQCFRLNQPQSTLFFYSYLDIFLIQYLHKITISNNLSALALNLVFLRIEITASTSALILYWVTVFLSALACQMYFSEVEIRHRVASSSVFSSPSPKSSLSSF